MLDVSEVLHIEFMSYFRGFMIILFLIKEFSTTDVQRMTKALFSYEALSVIKPVRHPFGQTSEAVILMDQKE